MTGIYMFRSDAFELTAFEMQFGLIRNTRKRQRVQLVSASTLSHVEGGFDSAKIKMGAFVDCGLKQRYQCKNRLSE